jgi:hypothetical protein
MIGYWHGGKCRPLIKWRRICANEKFYNLLGDTEFGWGMSPFALWEEEKTGTFLSILFFS